MASSRLSPKAFCSSRLMRTCSSAYLVEQVLGEILGFAWVGDETPVGDAVVFIGSCHDVLLVDLHGPPGE